MIRRAIRAGTRMHRCTRGCVVLFRGATGVGTHGLPTRSRVSDLTRRVIDAAISRRGGLYAAASRALERRFIAFDNATGRAFILSVPRIRENANASHGSNAKGRTNRSR